MFTEEKLYDTLGELLFVVAMADGIIQEEETKALENLLKGHLHEENIKWSFNYEVSKNTDIEELYKKVIITCKKIGPSPIYTEFISSMKIIAEAANGTEKSEEKIINCFSKELIEKFKNDIENIK
ncbi:MAG: hypothetical protein ACPGVH_00050 [Chitinophagales bacterium]